MLFLTIFRGKGGRSLDGKSKEKEGLWDKLDDNEVIQVNQFKPDYQQKPRIHLVKM